MGRYIDFRDFCALNGSKAPLTDFEKKKCGGCCIIRFMPGILFLLGMIGIIILFVTVLIGASPGNFKNETNSTQPTTDPTREEKPNMYLKALPFIPIPMSLYIASVIWICIRKEKYRNIRMQAPPTSGVVQQPGQYSMQSQPPGQYGFQYNQQRPELNMQPPAPVSGIRVNDGIQQHSTGQYPMQAQPQGQYGFQNNLNYGFNNQEPPPSYNTVVPQKH